MGKLAVFGAALCAVVIGLYVLAAEPRPGKAPAKEQGSMANAEQLLSDGNYKEAFELFKQLASDPKTPDPAAAHALQQAFITLARSNYLGLQSEVDAFLETVITAHANSPRVLRVASATCRSLPHWGYLQDQKFYRGNGDSRGQWVSSIERDRVRSLQLAVQAVEQLPAAGNDAKPDAKKSGQNDKIGSALTDSERAELYLNLAEAIEFARLGSDVWRWQELTDLSKLPDYDESQPRFRGWQPPTGNREGTPVDADGNPIYYRTPESFAAAQNDGERWRWALEQAKQENPAIAGQVELKLAQFLRSQFGVITLRSWSGFLPLMSKQQVTDQTGKPAEPGPFAFHTLGDGETIARLATGVRRFELPAEFNFIAILKQTASRDDSYAIEAIRQLATVYADRRQFPKAAEQWKRSFERSKLDSDRDQLEQIVDNWARFETVELQTADKNATIVLRYRNAPEVTFTAHEVKFQQLLSDVKDYLKSNPKNLDWQTLNIEDVGYRLVHEQQEKYLGRQVAEWTTKLNPPKGHFDAQASVEAPLKKAGVYLLSAKVPDGNTSKVIVWLTDSALAKKPLDQAHLYYMADATSGKPVGGAKFQFFGYRTEWQRDQRHVTLTSEKSLTADANGQLIVRKGQLPENYQWIIEATGGENRFAYLGYNNVWFGQRHSEEYLQNKIYIITDRPVYRPDQTVKFKLWVRRADYSLPLDDNTYANVRFGVEIHDPQGNKVLDQLLTTDRFGGIEGSLKLGESAALGQYTININRDRNNVSLAGYGQFRVEEYKKPEFEVTVDAPAEPVMLGESIEATIKAKYYFGEPVANGTVSYKVTRTRHDAHWYPSRPWDWFYGRGYWWFAPNYSWYPGFANWGCFPPLPPWYGSPNEPPELVAQNEAKLEADGTFKVKIDTAIAKEIFSDSDHRYEITAEVTDASRRTITGSGSVLVPRQPFEVFAWVDRGYYRAGDTVQAHFQAQTIAEKPISGEAKITLYRVTYSKEGKPKETAVETVDAKPGEDGQITQKFTVAEAGQYRVAAVVTDAEGNSIEGGYLFTVLPKNDQPADPTDFRYNDLQITSEKAEYEPGEMARLLVSSDNPDATILLFIRPVNGVYPQPQMLKLDGKKDTVVEVPVQQKDMPNFFVEVLTIFDGKVHTAMREVIVPPEKRIVDVEVLPSKQEYRPGEQAKILVKLSRGGDPVVGDVALTMYDRSVEYISGGSNVEDIRQFFWQWRRSHSPQTEENLSRWFQNQVPPGGESMGDLGAFGHLVDRNQLQLFGMVDAEAAEGLAADTAMPAPAAAPMGAAAGFGGGGISDFARSNRGRGLGLRESGSDAKKQMKSDVAEAQAAGPLVEATVRSNFADTAYWRATGVANEQGIVEITMTMPENLTDWKIRTWTVAPGTRVGEGTASVVTRKNLLVRLQAPRFFTETDEVVLSANVHNYLSSDKQAKVSLELEGSTLTFLDNPTRTVTVPAGGETRVDWRVRAVNPGTAKITMKALTDEESDAMQQSFPVQVHGMLRTESYAGTIRPDQTEDLVSFRIPAERREADSDITVRFSPSLAAAMVDALPYLTGYPYGCTEQTLNRFLPTVITQNVLQQMNLDLKAIRDKRTNLNAQEIGDPKDRAADWGKRHRPRQLDKDPVFDEETVRHQAEDGLKRLVEMQNDDGGWGWFPGSGRGNPHITALVVHGLKIAKEAGANVPDGVYERGVDWLVGYQQLQITELKNYEKNEERVAKDPNFKRVQPEKGSADNLDAFVQMVLVEAARPNETMENYLYRDRTHLSVYALGMFGISLEMQTADREIARERLQMVLRNMSQFLIVDNENQTAYLRLNNGNSWWYWYGNEIEANAYYLKLLSRTDPKGDVAPKLVKYLLNNRKHATYWNSTRDTAIVIEAMAEYLKASGELKADLTIEVLYDGEKRQEVTVTRENLFSFDNTFTLTGDEVATGQHTITLRKKGDGPLYWNAYVTTFTKEPMIPAAGLEVKVRRNFYQLTLKEDATANVRGSRGQSVEQAIEKYDRTPLENGSTLESGDLVEVEVIVESKNDYEYLVFEDMKAAGFEPVEVRSGWTGGGYSGNGLGAYMELRDEKVAFFVERLPRGSHTIRYRLRAEIPGHFSALPTNGYAMYAPELRGNSNEAKLSIVDKPVKDEVKDGEK